jgi:DNA-binding protein HU-beta
MNKNDYINRISEELELTKKDVGNVINKLFDLMKEDLKNNDKIMISNFGTFETAKTKPFNVYSPYDGKLIENVSQVRVHFKSSNYIKNKK